MKPSSRSPLQTRHGLDKKRWPKAMTQIILNKLDLVTPEQAIAVKAWEVFTLQETRDTDQDRIRHINKYAKILPAVKGKVKAPLVDKKKTTLVMAAARLPSCATFVRTPLFCISIGPPESCTVLVCIAPFDLKQLTIWLLVCMSRMIPRFCDHQKSLNRVANFHPQ